MKITVIIIVILLPCTTCNKETNEETPIIAPSFGNTELIVVYKIIFLGDSDTLFFHAATTDTSIIRKAEQELSKPLEDRLKHVNGLLASGNCDYNPHYAWHFIPEEWDLVEASIEWCDVFPENPDSTGLDRICPWSSRVYEPIN